MYLLFKKSPNLVFTIRRTLQKSNKLALPLAAVVPLAEPPENPKTLLVGAANGSLPAKGSLLLNGIAVVDVAKGSLFNMIVKYKWKLMNRMNKFNYIP